MNHAPHPLAPAARVAALAVAVLSMPLAARSDESAELASKLAAYMDAQVEVKHFSGAVLVERDGKPLLRKAYGKANLEHDVPNTPETRFRLGSITKSFTAMAIMVLQEQGKLNVEDPVSKQLPATPEAWKDVTIRHLLTHTSGIPSFTSFPDNAKRKRERTTVHQMIERFRDLPLEFAPGERFEYSNSGYFLLGAIIERASGKSYEAFLQEAVLDPLGLKDTGYDHHETVLPRRASGYEIGPDGKPRNSDFIDMSVPFSAGALYSTVDDLARWSDAFDTKKLVSTEAHEAIATPFKDNYAYGWTVSERNGHKRIGHGGGIDGFVTTLDRYPDDKLRIVVLSNLGNTNPGAIGAALAAIVFGDSYELPRERKEISLAPEVLDRYVGRYRLLPQLELTFKKEGDKLIGQPTGQRPAELFAESETTFFLKVVDATVEFVKNDEGKVTGLIFKQNGRDLKGERLPDEPAKESNTAPK